MNNAISWDHQRTFLAVLEEGSLSGAARRLGVSQPTVRSRIEALEGALGAVLFTRSVRGLAPTDIARALGEPARAMAMASELFVRCASAPPGASSGTVRLSVPEFMGIEVVPPVLASLRRAYPGICVELELSNALSDVLRQEADVAIRTVAPTQQALVARRVASIPLRFFASVGYLERHGVPQALSELVEHDLIGPDRSPSDRAFAASMGPVFTRCRFVLRTDSHPAQIAAARAGVGIAVVQAPVGLRDPVLRPVLPDVTVARLGVWVVTHEDLRRLPRIRAVFDALVEALS